MAPPRVIVLDASALLDGADASRPEAAETLRDLQARHPCRAPALLAWELGNVIHRKHPDVFGPRRVELVEVLLDGVDLESSDEPSRARCATLVAETPLTFYDAAYLDLALSVPSGVLVSQDRRLVSVARERGASAYTLDEAARAMKAGEL